MDTCTGLARGLTLRGLRRMLRRRLLSKQALQLKSRLFSNQLPARAFPASHREKPKESRRPSQERMSEREGTPRRCEKEKTGRTEPGLMKKLRATHKQG